MPDRSGLQGRNPADVGRGYSLQHQVVKLEKNNNVPYINKTFSALQDLKRINSSVVPVH